MTGWQFYAARTGACPLVLSLHIILKNCNALITPYLSEAYFSDRLFAAGLTVI
jgi:hypothetical protein